MAGQIIAHEIDEGEIGAGRGGVEGDEAGQHLASDAKRRAAVGLAASVGGAHTLLSWVVAGLEMMARNSRRVRGSERKVPSIWLVTMLMPGLCTPRVVMH